MKIKELKLHPFAGTKDKTVRFKLGLNVILGANEAGKSTLIKGLRCLFFTSPELSPVRLKNEIKPYLPINGGDTIRISADIDLEGENYTVEKELGAVKKARLILPSESELNNIAQVEIELAKMLGFSKATYEQVLITYQTDLARTIDTLKREGGETITSLSDNLRKNIFELDGISIEKLKAETNQQVEEYFNNWDEIKNQPRDGKDISNPHKRNVGKILEAYYLYRNLDKQLTEAWQHELQIDTINAQLQIVTKQLEELLAYKNQFAPIVEDARKRQLLENELKMLQQQKGAIAEVSEKWPVEANKLQEARKKREEQTEISQALEKNIAALKQYQKSLEIRSLYEKAKVLVEDYKQEQEVFKQVPEVKPEQINQARKLERELDKFKNIIEAQKLKIAIRAKNEVSFGLKRGLGESENITFTEGEMIQYDAAGRIQIEHPDFTIAIVSGEADIKQILKSIEAKQAELEAYLQGFQVENIEGLEKLKSEFEKASIHIQTRKKEIENLLKGQKMADLEKQIEAIENPHISESLEMLQSQFLVAQKELVESRSTERTAVENIQNWEKKFGSKDELLDKLLENKSQISGIEKQMSNLKSLPENITDSQQFLNEFNRKTSELERVQNEEMNLVRKRMELDRNQPEETTEDLQDKLARAQSQFQNALRKGKAYKRVQTELNNILDELDKDTFTPLKERTEYYFHKLTGGKYQTIKMDETVPADIEINGAWLPANLLSTGTLDLLALATRLAMADFYLKDKNGFIVLDDPLVNLDPARQEMAAICLREIAEQKQVIVLTCHPTHAALLQGDLIEL